MGISTTRIPSPQVRRAPSASAGSAIIVTGSKRAMAEATVAYARRTGSRSGKVSGWQGHAIQQPLWGAHSGGM